MSQAKVNKYKEEKANRKKIMRREKIKQACARVVAWAILLAIVAWAGVSGYNYYESKRPAKTYVSDVTAIEEYLSSIDVE